MALLRLLLGGAAQPLSGDALAGRGEGVVAENLLAFRCESALTIRTGFIIINRLPANGSRKSHKPKEMDQWAKLSRN
jgi:hypothetical protein